MTRRVKVLDYPPAIVNPLSVSIQSSGTKRLILDLKNLSVKILKWLSRFCPRDFICLIKFDLKSGYHHVEIFPDHRGFLAFSWDFGKGVIKHFQFAVLLFGLSSAPYLLSLRC